MTVFRNTAVCLIVFSMAFTPFLTSAGDLNVEMQIKALMDSHARALDKKDISAMMALWATGDSPAMMGDMPGERWVGTEAIRQAYLDFFKTFDSEIVTYPWATIGSDGDIAWFMAMCRVVSYLEDEKAEFPITWSAVLKKTDGHWLLVTSHFSSPIGEAQGEP